MAPKSGSGSQKKPKQGRNRTNTAEKVPASRPEMTEELLQPVVYCPPQGDGTTTMYSNTIESGMAGSHSTAPVIPRAPAPNAMQAVNENACDTHDDVRYYYPKAKEDREPPDSAPLYPRRGSLAEMSSHDAMPPATPAKKACSTPGMTTEELVKRINSFRTPSSEKSAETPVAQYAKHIPKIDEIVLSTRGTHGRGSGRLVVPGQRVSSSHGVMGGQGESVSRYRREAEHKHNTPPWLPCQTPTPAAHLPALPRANTGGDWYYNAQLHGPCPARRLPHRPVRLAMSSSAPVSRRGSVSTAQTTAPSGSTAGRPHFAAQSTATMTGQGDPQASVARQEEIPRYLHPVYANMNAIKDWQDDIRNEIRSVDARLVELTREFNAEKDARLQTVAETNNDPNLHIGHELEFLRQVVYALSEKVKALEYRLDSTNDAGASSSQHSTTGNASAGAEQESESGDSVPTPTAAFRTPSTHTGTDSSAPGANEIQRTGTQVDETGSPRERNRPQSNPAPGPAPAPIPVLDEFSRQLRDSTRSQPAAQQNLSHSNASGSKQSSRAGQKSTSGKEQQGGAESADNPPSGPFPDASNNHSGDRDRDHGRGWASGRGAHMADQSHIHPAFRTKPQAQPTCGRRNSNRGFQQPRGNFPPRKSSINHRQYNPTANSFAPRGTHYGNQRHVSPQFAQPPPGFQRRNPPPMMPGSMPPVMYHPGEPIVGQVNPEAGGGWLGGQEGALYGGWNEYGWYQQAYPGGN
ncbi:hypothetical protein FQN53_006795 [Emmonsiellopsis sp. PD_33]|nr:hypothetical protein FQN53_006795 [Emmonsiellopsis sp. PD_33]